MRNSTSNRIGKKRCEFCQKWFEPQHRARRHQRYCSNETCQLERKIVNNKDWHGRHPDYNKARKSKIRSWAKSYPNYWREWRKRHPDYVAQDNLRRRTTYRLAAVLSDQDQKGKTTVDKLESILKLFHEFSEKQDLIYRSLKVKKFEGAFLRNNGV